MGCPGCIHFEHPGPFRPVARAGPFAAKWSAVSPPLKQQDWSLRTAPARALRVDTSRNFYLLSTRLGTDTGTLLDHPCVDSDAYAQARTCLAMLESCMPASLNCAACHMQRLPVVIHCIAHDFSSTACFTTACIKHAIFRTELITKCAAAHQAEVLEEALSAAPRAADLRTSRRRPSGRHRTSRLTAATAHLAPSLAETA